MRPELLAWPVEASSIVPVVARRAIAATVVFLILSPRATAIARMAIVAGSVVRASTCRAEMVAVMLQSFALVLRACWRQYYSDPTAAHDRQHIFISQDRCRLKVQVTKYERHQVQLPWHHVAA